MAFWRRKSKEQFITLGLNQPSPQRATEATAPPQEAERGGQATPPIGLDEAFARLDAATQSPDVRATTPLEAPAALSQGEAAPAPAAPVTRTLLEPTPTGAPPTPPPVD